MKQAAKIETLHLFPVLDRMLIDLLRSLTDDEWNAQTVARRWKVKDVASHLLDGNLRALSTSRDGYFGETPNRSASYQDLVAFLNDLNLSWTKAAKRLSPRVLISLLETTGKEYYDHLGTLDPFGNAVFPVAWAGHETSPNWFHIAREYTEKFLHQQQIRDAVGKPGLITKEYFYPFLDTLMTAFPHTFRGVDAETGTIVSLTVSTTAGGQWCIVKERNGWTLSKDIFSDVSACVTIDPESAWKLFSGSWKPEHVLDRVEISGDRIFGKQALSILAVMA